MRELEAAGYNAWTYYTRNPELKQVPEDITLLFLILPQVLDMIRDGFYSPDSPDDFKDVVENLLKHDRYLGGLGDVLDAGRYQDLYRQVPHTGRL